MSGTGSTPTAPSMDCIVRCLAPIPRMSSSAAMATTSRLRCARVAFDLRRAANRRLQRRRWRRRDKFLQAWARSTIVITRFVIPMMPALPFAEITVDALASSPKACCCQKHQAPTCRPAQSLPAAPNKFLEPVFGLEAFLLPASGSAWQPNTARKEPRIFHCVLCHLETAKTPGLTNDG